jgi:hypothetical protein
MFRNHSVFHSVAIFLIGMLKTSQMLARPSSSQQVDDATASEEPFVMDSMASDDGLNGSKTSITASFGGEFGIREQMTNVAASLSTIIDA